MTGFIPPSIAAATPHANPALYQQLHDAIAQKTKPPGSLGLLEKLALQLGLILRSSAPQLIDPAILIFAADHGIVAEQVSAYPQSVTWQMVENFLAHGAAINVFARQHGCALHIIDAGVNHDFGTRFGLLDRKIGPGTSNFASGCAMTPEQTTRALMAGAALVADCPGNLLGFGEMGIGNTSSAAALMQALTGLPLERCVGAGTGLDAKGVAHKQQVIARALAWHAQNGTPLDQPFSVLACFGGFEIAMMVGAMLAAAAAGKVLLIDGFISSAALLVAWRMQPAILDYCVFSHCSAESGHAQLLAHWQAEPLLRLDLRLGEGSGCALALPLLVSATAFLNQMASFASAGVDNRTESA